MRKNISTFLFNKLWLKVTVSFPLSSSKSTEQKDFFPVLHCYYCMRVSSTNRELSDSETSDCWELISAKSDSADMFSCMSYTARFHRLVVKKINELHSWFLPQIIISCIYQQKVSDAS